MGNHVSSNNFKSAIIGHKNIGFSFHDKCSHIVHTNISIGALTKLGGEMIEITSKTTAKVKKIHC